MKCHELARRLEAIAPDADSSEIARLCHSLLIQTDETAHPDDDARLRDLCRRMRLRLNAATDQHAATMAELEALANSDPQEFTPDQVWVLVRAIKVQNQLLAMHLGVPVLDV